MTKEQDPTREPRLSYPLAALAGKLAERVQRWIPRASTIGHILEERSPAASRVFLSAASSVSTPFTIAMGMTIEQLDDSGAWVALPDWARNRGADGAVHPAAIAALIQFAASTYWSRHVDSRFGALSLRRFEARHAGPVRGALRAHVALADDARESALLRLRSEGRAEVTCSARAFDASGRLVAEADITWELSAAPALTGSQSPGSFL